MALASAAGKMTTGRVSLVKNIQAFAEQHRPIAESNFRRCVGLDFGTNCGVAFVDFMPGRPVDNTIMFMGQLDLSIGPYDTRILSLTKLKQFLTEMNPDLVMYENVKYDPPMGTVKSIAMAVARTVPTAEFFGALKGIVGVWGEEHNVPTQGLAIAAIKKYATGIGNAGKPAMIQAANERFGTSFEVDGYEKTGVDNICDAAFVCQMGLDMYYAGLS
jgi:Holliday junction resolvasome RuvABC endonuclease subunit